MCPPSAPRGYVLGIPSMDEAFRDQIIVKYRDHKLRWFSEYNFILAGI